MKGVVRRRGGGSAGARRMLLSAEWLSQSGEGPIREPEHFAFGRPGIDNSSPPRLGNQPEQREGFAETPPCREPAVVSGVEYIVCPLFRGRSSNSTPCIKLCQPPRLVTGYSFFVFSNNSFQPICALSAGEMK